MGLINSAYKEKDLELWRRYKRHKSPETRSALLQRFDRVIQNQVNRWSGPVPREVLLAEAKLLAVKAFDSYSEDKGAALATHVTNNLAPLSRVVYTHQNTARLPENVTLKVQAYKNAVDHLTHNTGRHPTADELHQELGWSVPEINRVNDYMRRDLTESVGGLSDSFFSSEEDEDDNLLAAIYFDLLPGEKVLFEHTTGYNGARILNNTELMQKLGITQAQLSYKKSLLRNKIQSLTRRHDSAGRIHIHH